MRRVWKWLSLAALVGFAGCDGEMACAWPGGSLFTFSVRSPTAENRQSYGFIAQDLVVETNPGVPSACGSTVSSKSLTINLVTEDS